MERTIKLCMKMMTAQETKREFPSFFGYKVDPDQEGTLQTREYPTEVVKEDGSKDTVMKAHSFKVSLSEDIEKELKKDNQFPYFVVYDDEVVGKDGKPLNFITWDKEKGGKYRLDKNGRKHKVLVLRELVTYGACPRTSIDFEELDSLD